MDPSDGPIDNLIASLAHGLKPVKRLNPPSVRAFQWLGLIAIMAALLILGFADLRVFMERAQNPKLAFELAWTLMTGVLAVFAAFELSLPDRSPRWALLPLPSFALWLGSSGYSCWRHWISVGPQGWHMGEGMNCFLWIVGFGIPLGVSLFVVLRRSHPLSPAIVAATGGLGVASLAAFLLQFFHPFDVTFIDLGMHIAGVAVVVVAARAAARPALADTTPHPLGPLDAAAMRR